MPCLGIPPPPATTVLAGVLQVGAHSRVPIFLIRIIVAGSGIVRAAGVIKGCLCRGGGRIMATASTTTTTTTTISRGGLLMLQLLLMVVMMLTLMILLRAEIGLVIRCGIRCCH